MGDEQESSRREFKQETSSQVRNCSVKLLDWEQKESKRQKKMAVKTSVILTFAISQTVCVCVCVRERERQLSVSQPRGRLGIYPLKDYTVDQSSCHISCLVPECRSD